MAHNLIKLRALQGFVDAGQGAKDGGPGVPVSIVRGDILERSEEVAERWIESGLVVEVLSPIDQMVQTAHDIGGIAFVSDNEDLAAACAQAGITCLPTKGKK